MIHQIAGSGSANSRIIADWWKEKDTSIHDAIFSLVGYIDETHKHRESNNKLYYALYNGAEPHGLSAYRYAQRKAYGSRLQHNVVHSMISTVHSKVTKNKTRILHLTEGGSYSARHRAKKLTRVSNGTLEQIDFHRRNASAWRDGCIFDQGYLKIFEGNNQRIACERVFPNEIKVDEVESINGEPRSLHQCKSMAREAVIGWVESLCDAGRISQGKKRDIVSKLRVAPRHEDSSKNSRYIADMIEVVESWHLRSWKGADDGKHCIVAKNTPILCEEWDRDYFPFVRHSWDPMPLGFHGQGLAAQLAGIQDNINATLDAINEHMNLAMGFVAVERGSNINLDSMAVNEIGRFIEFDNVDPKWVAPQPLSPLFFDWLQDQYVKAFEIAGISQMSATGRKPSGLDAAVAMREYQDIETERFAEKVQRFEESHVHADQIILDLYEGIYERDGNFKVPSVEGKHLESIDWDKARMDRESFVTRVQTSSFLPSTPAGKWATIKEMINEGAIPREEGMMLLDYPDLEKFNELNNAAVRNIDRKIERMLDPEWDEERDGAQYLPPEPFDNHNLAMRRVTSAYQVALLDGSPEENMQLLRDYLTETQAEIERMQQAQPMPGAEGAPGAPPLSAELAGG